MSDVAPAPADPPPPGQVPPGEAKPAAGTGSKDKVARSGGLAGRVAGVIGGSLLFVIMVLLFAPYLPDRVAANAYQVWRGVSRLCLTAECRDKWVAIAVGSPAVQTRERLINDRFEQVAWTDMLLKSTMPVTAPKLRSTEALKDDAPASQDGEDSASKERSHSAVSPPAPQEASGEDDETALKKPPFLAGQSTERTAATEFGGEWAAWFNRMRDFRESVRTERAGAMLDDRHDMDGNTLYSLSFDTSVVPSPGTQGFAAIQILITNDPEEAGPINTHSKYAMDRFRALKKSDWFEIYLDWMERTQRLINDNLHNSDARFLDSKLEYKEIMYRLRSRLCEVYLRASENKLQSADNAQAVENACHGNIRPPSEQDALSHKANLILDKIASIERDMDSQYPAVYEAIWQKTLVGFESTFVKIVKDADATGNRLDHNILAGYRDDIERWVKDPVSGLPTFSEASDRCYGLSVKLQNPTPAIPIDSLEALTKKLAASGAYLNGPALTSDKNGTEGAMINCPYVYRPLDKLLTLEAWLRQAKKDGAHTSTGVPDVNLRVSRATPLASEDPYLHAVDITISSASSQSPSQARRSLSCLAAFELADILDRGQLQVIPGRGANSYNRFFEVGIIEPASGECGLRLSPKIRSLHEQNIWFPITRNDAESVYCKNGKLPDTGKPSININRNWIEFDGRYYPPTEACATITGAPPGAMLAYGEEVDVLGNLSVNLEAGPAYTGDHPGATSEVFPYGLTPRSTRTFEVEKGTSHSLQASATGVSAATNKQGTMKADISESEIVGFVPHAAEVRKTRRMAEFGWIVTPSVNSEGVRALPLEYVTLGALVAVPSWWRTALLSICAAGVSDDDLPQLAAGKFWAYDRGRNDIRQTHCRIETLRLPGNAADVSRRLGIEVLTTPYVRTADQNPILRSGEPGKLLLKGDRLWRSTVVTLGGQRADQIVVLPDLRGIIAEFRCVETPPYDATPDGKIHGVPIQVWTSEGETSAGSADVDTMPRRLCHAVGEALPPSTQTSNSPQTSNTEQNAPGGTGPKPPGKSESVRVIGSTTLNAPR